MRSARLIFLLFVAAPAAAYNANGVTLGASEAGVRRSFPSVHCKALEWQSRAADRRCDGSRLRLGETEVRITFYLRKDALEAFDVRFNARDLERFAAFLRQQYGPPHSDELETFHRPGKADRKVHRIVWQGKGEHAVLSAPQDSQRASLLVWRGDFEQEIYR